MFNDEKDQFVKQFNKGTKLYRARIIDNSDFGDSNAGFKYNEEEKFHGYNAVNSCEPIIGKGVDGRNNINGMPYLYLASNEETACTEVKSRFGEFISLAEFEVKRQMDIVDSSNKKVFL